MWDAIHKKTGKRFFAGDVWTPGLFNNPHEEKWIAPKDNISNWEELNIDEIQLKIWEGHFRKNHLVSTHFKIFNCPQAKTTLESDEHKRKKILLSFLLTHDVPLSFYYDTEKYSLSDLPIDRKKIRKNIKTLEVRRNIAENHRIADVLIPFKYSNFWGNGLVIEVRESELKSKAQDKEFFWFSRGYSIIWADKEDFTDNGIKKNELKIIPYSIGQYLLRSHHEKIITKRLGEIHKKYTEVKKIKSEMERFPRIAKMEYEDYNKWWTRKKNYLTCVIKNYESLIQNMNNTLNHSHEEHDRLKEKDNGNKTETGLNSWL